MDFEVLDMSEVIPDLVDDIIRTLTFNRCYGRNRFEVGKSDFKKLANLNIPSVYPASLCRIWRYL